MAESDAAAPAKKRKRQGKRPGETTAHQCHICERSFSRGEHLSRHLLTHTDKRPYQCAACGDTFQRVDVLQRHATSFCPYAESAESTIRSGPKKRIRAHAACYGCHEKKLKCSGSYPCSNCVRRNAECRFQRRLPPTQLHRSDAGDHVAGGSEGTQELLAVQLLGRQSDTTGIPNEITQDVPDNVRLAQQMAATDHVQPFAPQTIAPPTDWQPLGLEDNLWDASSLMQDDRFIAPLGYTDMFAPYVDNVHTLLWSDIDLNPLIDTSSDLPPDHGNFSGPSQLEIHELSSSENLSSPWTMPDLLDRVDRNWLMQPLIPRRYDIELLEMLLSVSQRHLSTILSSFSGQLISEDTLPVEVIAMAAFGATFTALPDSGRIASWLYTDAQRMVTHYVCQCQLLAHGHTESLLRTLVILELFGHCSGHERSNDTSEAYHRCVVQVMQDFDHQVEACSEQHVQHDCRTTFETFPQDLMVLEAYRATLSSLHPIWSPELCHNLASLSPNLREHTSTGAEGAQSSPVLHYELAPVAVLAFQGKRLRDHHNRSASAPNWRAETTELYAMEFASRNNASMQRYPSLELLLRTSLWTVRAPIDIFHQATFRLIRQKKFKLGRRLSHALLKWHTGPDLEIVFDHIKRVITTTETSLSSDAAHVEAPHDAICVYMAVLALCFSRLSPSRESCLIDNETADWVQRGIKCISQLRANVQELMTRILSTLHDIGSAKSPSKESGIASPAPRIWYYRRQPTARELVDSSIPPDQNCLAAFKTGLRAQRTHNQGKWVSLDESISCVRELKTIDTRPSYPISCLPATTELPNHIELERLEELGSTYLQSRGHISTQSLSQDLLPIKLALVSLGATLSSSPHRREIWFHAHRLLIAAIGADNRLVRNQTAFLTWLLDEIAGIMSSDQDIWRISNMSHGMMEAAIRRCWSVKQLHEKSPNGSADEADMLLCILETDLVRALTINCIPTTVSSFSWMTTTGPTTLPIAITVTAMFSGEPMPKVSADEAFLRLLLLLHEITRLSMMFGGSTTQSTNPWCSMIPLSVEAELRAGRKRTTQALEAWRDAYFDAATPAVKALFHFCELYYLVPNLHTFPAEARENSKERTIFQAGGHQDDGIPAEASHHAWLLYDQVRLSAKKNAGGQRPEIYLPIIAFLAALCIWKNIQSDRAESRPHMSKRVLLLFEQELRALSWQGSEAMADCICNLV